MSESSHQLFARDRIIIVSAPNGARRNKRDHPALPITADELANEATALVDAGVAVLHLHVRNAQGRHTLDVNAYRVAIEAIERRVGDELVIQVTTEAVGIYRPAQQLALVKELRPEAVSLALREICPDQSHEEEVAEFFSWLNLAAIWPQVILYSPQELIRFDSLRAEGFFGRYDPFSLLVLGRYTDHEEGTMDQLDEFLRSVDCSQFPWAVCCFGLNEQAVMLAAAGKGGHARLGFENNLWLPDGKLAVNNAELVTAFRENAVESGRRPATANETRTLMRAGQGLPNFCGG